MGIEVVSRCEIEVDIAAGCAADAHFGAVAEGIETSGYDLRSDLADLAQGGADLLDDLRTPLDRYNPLFTIGGVDQNISAVIHRIQRFRFAEINLTFCVRNQE